MTTKKKIAVMLLVAVAVALLAMLTSCKTKYIPVEKVKYEKVVKHDTVSRVDSFYHRDSICVTQYMRGDTVYQDKVKYTVFYKDRWRDRIVYRDSFVLDSIPYPVEVEKPLSWAQKRLIGTGKIFVGLIASLLLLIIGDVAWRAAKKWIFR